MRLFLNVHAENSKGYQPQGAGGIELVQTNMTYRPNTKDGGKRIGSDGKPLKRSSAEELKRRKYKYSTDGKKVTKVTTGKSATLLSQRGNKGGTLRPANGGALGIDKALRTNQPLRGRNAKQKKATRQGALVRAKSLLRNPRA